MALIAYELIATPRIWGSTGLIQRIGNWFRDLVGAVRGRRQSLEAQHIANGATLAEGVSVRKQIRAEAPLEAQLQYFREAIIKIEDDLARVERELLQRIRDARQSVAREREERKREVDQVRQRLQESLIGGLHLEWVALSWLGAGIIGGA